MLALKFSRLSLCSVNERSALQLDFDPKVTVLTGGNGFGKSAIVKSLYEALGARPHKIDDDWKRARVSVLVEFSIDGVKYSALKSEGVFSVFDAANNVLIETEHVNRELAPFWARLLNFKLEMVNKEEQIVIPPPAYAFAPYYVDQDQGWTGPWKSFSDLYLPHSPQNLAEYHSGLRPNAFYVARAERDKLAKELRTLDIERRGFDATLRRIREAVDAVAFDLDLAAFEAETLRFVRESQHLHDAQAGHRKKLGEINEEMRLWKDQEDVIRTALAEMDTEFHDALHFRGSVDCPMCGQHYENRIADQFELVEDQDSLMDALRLARKRVSELEEKARCEVGRLDEIDLAYNRVRQAMSAHKAGITLQDVVRAEGKSEATRILSAQLSDSEEKYGKVLLLLENATESMDRATNKERTKEINTFFADRLRAFARQLDVRLEHAGPISVRGTKMPRGSEGPRGLVAYYFAFLKTAHKYGSSTFCPIIVDAPNQQGQDPKHLKDIMEFMLGNVPESGQLIVAAETMPTDAPVLVRDISSRKNAVLREDQYASVSNYMRPYLQQFLLS